VTPEIEGYVTQAEIDDFAEQIGYRGKCHRNPYLAVGALTVMTGALTVEHWRIDNRPRIAFFCRNKKRNNFFLSPKFKDAPNTQEIAARAKLVEYLWVRVVVWGWRDTSTKKLATIGTIHDLRRHLDSQLPKPKTPKPSQEVLFDMSLGDPEA